MEELIIVFTLMPILIIASIWDYKTKKIPNALIFLGLIVGTGYQFIFNGWKEGLFAVFVVFLIFITFLLFWGVIGAGDIKLLMVLGVFLGYFQTIQVFLLGMLVLIVFYSLIRRNSWFVALKNILFKLFYKIPMKPEKKINGIPLAPFILVGTVMMIL